MIIIDYNAIAISTVVVQKIAIDENLIRHMILNSIRAYRKKHFREFGEIVIVSDAGNNWRYDAFPNYKAKRKDARKDSTMDWKELFRVTNMVYKELQENFPYRVLKVDKCEADDIIGQLCMGNQEFGQVEPILIISSDKDFVQLQRFSNVKQYSPILKKFLTVDNPRQQLAELILKGDQADGIPNVLSPDNCMVEGIRQSPLRQAAIDQLMKDPKALGEEVYRNYLRNKKLIDLTETPESVKHEIINTINRLDYKAENKKKVMPYLITQRCTNLLEVVGDFI